MNAVIQSGGSDSPMNAVICLSLSDCSESIDQTTCLFNQVQHEVGMKCLWVTEVSQEVSVIEVPQEVSVSD